MKDHIQIISYSRGGIYEESTNVCNFGEIFRVEYTKCRYSGSKAVSRALLRMELGEDHYHALYNNSHFFVCWAKTGAEHSLAHVIDEFDFDEGMYV